MRRRGAFKQSGKAQLDAAIHAHRRWLAQRHGRALPAYERLLRHVRARSTLLRLSDGAQDHRIKINDALLAIALAQQRRRAFDQSNRLGHL